MKIPVAVVGAGDWGRNLVRNFNQAPAAELRWICDQSEKRLELMRTHFPEARTTTSLEEVLADDEVRAVAVATPAVSHADVTRHVLDAGRHAFVEKPLALSSEDAEDLCVRAEAAGLILMTGHLLLHHPAVERLKSLVDSGELGRIYYLYSQRVNLGKIRADENALWSFAPHDLSVILHLLDDEPVSVSARGHAYLREGVEDVVFVTLSFASGVMANVHLSWLDPHKLRKFTVVGNKKMAVFDDMEATEKLRIYDKGVEIPGDYASYGDYIGLRFGDITIPRIDGGEPLRIEVNRFLEAVREGVAPESDGRNGLRVVRVLEAAQRSLRADGVPQSLA